jgi:hypothetical protein
VDRRVARNHESRLGDRERAIEALGEARATRAVDCLLDNALGERNKAHVIRTAVVALCRINDARATRPLAAALPRCLNADFLKTLAKEGVRTVVLEGLVKGIIDTVKSWHPESSDTKAAIVTLDTLEPNWRARYGASLDQAWGELLERKGQEAAARLEGRRRGEKEAERRMRTWGLLGPAGGDTLGNSAIKEDLLRIREASALDWEVATRRGLLFLSAPEDAYKSTGERKLAGALEGMATRICELVADGDTAGAQSLAEVQSYSETLFALHGKPAILLFYYRVEALGGRGLQSAADEILDRRA